MALSEELKEILCCPKCKGDLEFKEEENKIICQACHLIYPIKDDIPYHKPDMRDESFKYNKPTTDVIIVVVISTTRLILPDLTGFTQVEIFTTLMTLNINFVIEVVTDNTVEDQTFSSYGDGLE